MVNWHEVTPVSRMLAIIVFVGLIPVLFFYLGMQYQDMQDTKNIMRTYDFPRLQVYTGMGVPLRTVGTSTSSTTQR